MDTGGEGADARGTGGARETVQERVVRVLAGAGASVRLHAVDVRGGREIAVAADEQVVLASVAKILLVLEFARQACAGQIDPRERIVLTAADRLGGWGVAGCADDVTMSLRDLAYFAMSVSDNTAADALLRRVGLDTVRLLAAELGLDRTRVLGGPREHLESMFEDAGAGDAAEFAELYPGLEPRRVRGFAALDPARTTSGTARDVTTLLRLIWQDRAGPAAACAWVRELMSRQAFRHRLASGFPDGVRVAAKTGTLPGHHIEAGVVHYPDGGRYAVAVFAETAGLDPVLGAVDRAIGVAARVAVEGLRAAAAA
ncbi:serine hydrolase [Streptomyces sp. NPDC021020]|uniref:serine hydrolase n=1 Tax=Streptomyces sp. NPDC021020 TaxID=3365109 RepID=UPI003799D603